MSSALILSSYFLVSWIVSIALHGNDFIGKKRNVHNAHKLLFFTLPVLVLGFYFIALKPFTAGGDTPSYLKAFSLIGSPLTATADASYGSEFLFWPIQAILKSLVDERGWYIANFVIISILNYLAYKKITEKTAISPLIFSLTLLTFYVALSGNAMRQIYAIPLGVIAFHYCYKKEYTKFLIFTALSIAFHWSAIIILISPIFTRLPNRAIYYIVIPIIALVCSALITPFVDVILSITKLEWLAVKSDAYLKGGVVSHISAIWKTLTFWFCVVVYTLLILFKITTDTDYTKITKYLLMFISIMFFSVQNPDISDRYMACFLILAPLPVTILLLKLKISNQGKNMLLAFTFSLMALLVYTRESIMTALGIVY